MSTLTTNQIKFIAQAAGVCETTVRRFIRGKEVRRDTLDKILTVLRGPECAHLGWLLRRHA